MKFKTTDPAVLRRRTRNRAAVRKWKRLHPMAARAHAIVRRALRDGTLVRGPCEECGGKGEHGHHDDYGLPLEVRWFCRKHHAAHHTKIKLVQLTLNFRKPKEGEQ